MYDLRITNDEVNATLLQLLPGVSITKAFSTDSNSFLYHANWVTWGAKVAGNLINLVRLPADLDALEAQKDVHRQNTLATAATIAMQVHIARARLAVQTGVYRNAERFAAVQRKILHQVETSVMLGKVAQQTLTREEQAMLLSEVRAILAFADLYAAWAAYGSARGNEPVQSGEANLAAGGLTAQEVASGYPSPPTDPVSWSATLVRASSSLHPFNQ